MIGFEEENVKDQHVKCFIKDAELKAAVDINIDDISNSNSNLNIDNNNEKIKILLFEDICFNVKYFRKIFEKKDYVIESAENRKIGVELIKSKNDVNHFDIIFMDLQIAEMNGFQTTKFLRENLKCTSIILTMTSNKCGDEKEYCLS
jgi:CheY-like chemotaxis protein